MKELKEWHFSFGLMAKEEEKLVSEQEASDLLDAIIDYAEERGLSVGGGFAPFEEAEEK